MGHGPLVRGVRRFVEVWARVGRTESGRQVEGQCSACPIRAGRAWGLEAEAVDVVLGDGDPAITFKDLGGAFSELHGFVTGDTQVDTIFDCLAVEDLGR